MTINLTGDLRYDTRGLPEGYDPHNFYEYRRETLVSSATGFESFAYKYIPWSLLKSFAFAIDPVAAFKVAPMAITPANRTKYRLTASVLNDRTRTWRKSHEGYTQEVNYRNVSICWSPYFVRDSYVIGPIKSAASRQDPLADTLKDTSRRTRLLGSDLGELELFKSFINSPPRSVREVRKITNRTHLGPVEPSCTAVGGIQRQGSGSIEVETTEFSPTGGVLPRGHLESLRSDEIAFAKSLCSRHAINMLKDYSPKKREYSYFRNLAELRDIPRSIASLQSTLGNLRKLWYSLATEPSLRKRIFDLRATAKDIPNEYLSFHFGWRQTYNDLVDLLALPAKISKKNEFLIARSGKPTTFRVTRNIPSSQTASQAFDYDTTGYEYEIVRPTRIERESQLRLVINATFDFPNINVPRFRYENFLERTGINPRITDVYNLIPWTWLVDWFTGLGNYVELIDNINQDQNLINWGVISCRTQGKLITDFQSTSFIVDDQSDEPGGNVQTLSKVYNRHTSILNYECQTRTDVATILDVKRTSDPSSLTAYQKSIIGSLLAQRVDISRPNTFRVRS